MCYNGFTMKIEIIRDSKMEGVAKKILCHQATLRWLNVINTGILSYAGQTFCQLFCFYFDGSETLQRTTDIIQQ